MQRRQLVAALGAAAAASAAAALGCRRESSPGREAPEAIGAPRARLGVQLYTVRNSMASDFDRTLARVAAIGYTEVEFAGYFGRSPRRVRRSLEQHGLAAPSAHVTLETIEDEWREGLEAATEVGHRWLVLPWIDAARRATLDQWRSLAALLNRAGAVARDAGIRLAYHNHDYELAPIDGVVPFDLLLTETDPAVVGFEMDIYWVTKGGREPLQYLQQHPGRFELTHLKDSAGPPEHRMVDVGAGIIDWPAVLTAASSAGVRHSFVEHDTPPDELASIRASHAYLSALQPQLPASS